MGPMGAADLSAALWQERRQLELLLFRLETQRLHVAAGNIHWIAFTASEVESVLEEHLDGLRSLLVRLAGATRVNEDLIQGLQPPPAAADPAEALEQLTVA